MAIKKTEDNKKNAVAKYDGEISNYEIKNYIKQLEVQKHRRKFLNEKLQEESGKINILSKNISKMDSFNKGIDKEVMTIRRESGKLQNEIIELKLALDKAESESKLSRVKKFKRDILANAKILKNQEDQISELKLQRENILKNQKQQRNLLLEKREQIERMGKAAVENEFNDVNDELVELMQSTLANTQDKTQIISAALNEASQELNKIREFDERSDSKHREKIDILRTQMINLSAIEGEHSMTGSSYASPQPQTYMQPSHSAAPKSSVDIESELQLRNKLDRLVSQGLISERDRDDQLIQLERENAMRRIREEEYRAQSDSGNTGRRKRRRGRD